MFRLFLALLILAFVCMPLSAQMTCADVCKDKAACAKKGCDACKDKKPVVKCHVVKKPIAKCHVAKKIVVLKTCAKTKIAFVSVKLSKKQKAFFAKIAAKKVKKFPRLRLNKKQRKALFLALKKKFRIRKCVPVRKNEITKCGHWVFPAKKAFVILAYKHKKKGKKVVKKIKIIKKVEKK